MTDDIIELYEKRQADRALALEHGYEHPAGRITYFWHEDGVKPYPKEVIHHTNMAPAVHSDYPAYFSHASCKMIEGKAARREDMKRHNCVEYDPSTNYKKNTFNAESAIDKAVRQAAQQMGL